MMSELKNTKAIIFDLRSYPKSTMGRIVEYLKKRRTQFARITHPDLSYPGNFIFQDDDIHVGSKRFAKGIFHYKGKTIVLVNEITQSQAEWSTMAFQTVDGAVTVGSQTSGADGNVSNLMLTGNIKTNMTGLGVFYPDGTPTQRVGVKVDVEVKPTAKGIKERRDEVLEKALSLLK
jgi:C-terminal processing protease CtpA/Prc